MFVYDPFPSNNELAVEFVRLTPNLSAVVYVFILIVRLHNKCLGIFGVNYFLTTI